MSLVRVLRTAQQTLTRKIYVDEAFTDAGGAVTVEVKRLDGTLIASGSATDEPGTGIYSFVLTGGPTAPASATWQLDHLTVAWTGSLAGAVVTQELDHVEIVGGYLFGLVEARAAHPSLTDQNTYPTLMLAAKRNQVEQECEAICAQAFVPRFARTTLTGRGTRDLLLPHAQVRTLRAVSVDGTAVDTSQVALSSSGVLTRFGVFTWPAGSQVIVEYEHGLDYPPEDVRQAAILRLRSVITATRSGIPDRTLSYTTQDGATYRLTAAGPRSTGISEVDAAYSRHSLYEAVGFA